MRFSEFDLDQAELLLDKTRIKIGFTPAPESKFGRTLTIRGLNAFIAIAGGRPSSAVHLEDDGELDLMDGGRTSLGTLRISFGRPDGGRQHFIVGDSKVSLSSGECRMPILVDSPSRQLSFFLYLP